MSAEKTPVVFIHGLWLHASSWQPWMDLFREAGYETAAPGWPGDSPSIEETREHSDLLANHGIEEVTEHFARLIRSLGRLPIVIGHSFGGLIAQKLLGQGLAAGAVALDAAQMKGVFRLPLTQLRTT
jgi:pimeloyl-ACP methyl ester carboxylesterase